jgi:hypothetical protein
MCCVVDASCIVFCYFVVHILLYIFCSCICLTGAIPIGWCTNKNYYYYYYYYYNNLSLHRSRCTIPIFMTRMLRNVHFASEIFFRKIDNIYFLCQCTIFFSFSYQLCMRHQKKHCNWSCKTSYTMLPSTITEMYGIPSTSRSPASTAKALSCLPASIIESCVH